MNHQTIITSDEQAVWWKRWAHYEPNAPTVPLFVHVLFAIAYLVLAGNLLYARQNPSGTLAKGIFYQIGRSFCTPFWDAVGFAPPDAEILELTIASVIALISFAILHLALVWAVPDAETGLIMRIILNLFRLVFYVVATLFVLLIGIRMTIMTYQDITRPRIQLAFPVNSPKTAP